MFGSDDTNMCTLPPLGLARSTAAIRAAWLAAGSLSVGDDAVLERQSANIDGIESSSAVTALSSSGSFGFTRALGGGTAYGACRRSNSCIQASGHVQLIMYFDLST